MKKNNSNEGFTLIEMSIVLVIIAILTASAMYAGRISIQSANTLKAISVYNDLMNAIREFKTHYKDLPGDIPITVGAPEINGLSTQCLSIGNGDGLINGTLDGGGRINGGEAACLPEQLYQAGLMTSLEKDPISNMNVIRTPFGEISVIAKINSHVANIATFANRNVVNVVEITNLPCSAAKKFDSDFDNADISTGRAIAIKTDGAIMTQCSQDQTVPFLVLSI